jgi:hypothetical protein
MGKKLKVEASIDVKDGVHKGVITGIEFRETPYQYTDIIIGLEEFPDFEMKVGYPTIITPTSKLGDFCLRMGLTLNIGQEVDLDILKGKQVTFMTMKERGKDGKTYARIIPESVKDATETQNVG